MGGRRADNTGKGEEEVGTATPSIFPGTGWPPGEETAEGPRDPGQVSVDREGSTWIGWGGGKTHTHTHFHTSFWTDETERPKST